MNEKKKQFIFWLIGLGCGIVLSGILGIIVVLNTGEYKSSMLSRVEPVTEQKNIAYKEPIATALIVPQNKEKITSQSVKEDDIPVVTPGGLLVTPKEKEQKVVQVIIPSGINATETCKLLEEAGVVEDGDDFKEYISKQKKTTKLKDGKFSLPLEATYEELLSLIVTK